MKRLLFLFLFLAPMLSMAQRNQTIKGIVVDYKNILRQYYDKETNTIEFRYQMSFIPVLAFQVDYFASKGERKKKEN
jgi:hypothetical protein